MLKHERPCKEKCHACKGPHLFRNRIPGQMSREVPYYWSSLRVPTAGEYGELLLPGSAASADVGSGEDRPRSASSNDLVNLLESVLDRTQAAAAREYTLTALMKLSARLPDQLSRIQVGLLSAR